MGDGLDSCLLYSVMNLHGSEIAAISLIASKDHSLFSLCSYKQQTFIYPAEKEFVSPIFQIVEKW